MVASGHNIRTVEIIRAPCSSPDGSPAEIAIFILGVICQNMVVKSSELNE